MTQEVCVFCEVRTDNGFILARSNVLSVVYTPSKPQQAPPLPGLA